MSALADPLLLLLLATLGPVVLVALGVFVLVPLSVRLFERWSARQAADAAERRVQRAQVLEQTLRQVAEERGWTPTETGLEGRLGSHAVTVRVRGNMAEVTVPGLQTETQLAVPSLLGNPGSPSGDQRFDQRVTVLGGPEEVGRFPADIRHRVVRFGSRLVCAKGTLTVSRSVHLADPADLHDLLTLAEEIVQALSTPIDLVHTMRHDTDVDVRVRAMHVWFDQHPDDRGPLESLLQDSSDKVRLKAAFLLEQVDVLLELVNGGIPEARLAAVAALPSHALPPVCTALIGHHRIPSTWHRLIERIDSEGHAEAMVAVLPLLGVLLSRDHGFEPRQRESLTRRIVSLIARLPPDPDREQLLADVLVHTDLRDARAYAARALGRLGTIDTVPVLRGVQGTGTRNLDHHIDLAVRSIQARATGDRGGLSLAPSSGGELALAEPLDEDLEEPEADRIMAARQARSRSRVPER